MTPIQEGTYLVTGASGRTGSQVVLKLVDAGARVRAPVHNSQPEELANLGVEYTSGDYQDVDSLVKACDGPVRLGSYLKT